VPDGDTVAQFRHVGDRVLHRGRRIAFGVGTFESPDGDRFERDVIRDLGWVGVVPLLDDGRTVLMVRQYRGPIDATMLEIPAGLCDIDGEAPEVTGARELGEEVGQRAARMSLLARVHNSAGVSDEHGWVFLATGLTSVPDDRQGPEEQHMSVETLALADVPAMIADGRLTDAKSLIGLLLTLQCVDDSRSVS
jgi:ADP-ribose pyrophosphatase